MNPHRSESRDSKAEKNEGRADHRGTEDTEPILPDPESKKTRRKTTGLIGIIGKTNVGKSTLLNAILKSPLALVSRKPNATRKRTDFIVPYVDDQVDSQIIFIDTPGLHVSKKLLNAYMLRESKKAIMMSDLCIFMSTATRSQRAMSKEISYYEEFLSYGKRHIVVLNKIDLLSQKELLSALEMYKQYSESFISIIPLSAKNLGQYPMQELLKSIAHNLSEREHMHDGELMSLTPMREFYREAIRECVFERLSDEIPYESDVMIQKIRELDHMEVIHALIIVERDSQKSMIIGKQGSAIRSIGTLARRKCELLGGKKVFLSLSVKTRKGWSKDKYSLKKIGYDFDL